MSFGLDDDGFVPMRLSDIEEACITDLEDAIGPIDQSDDGVLRRIIGIESERIATLWELGSAVYAGLSPQSASGAQLDNAAELGGITRNAAAASTVVVGLTGTLGTVVPLGTQFSSATTGDIVESDGAKTIAATSLVHAEIDSGAAQDSTTYTVTIAGTPCTFVSGVGATPAQISAGIAAAIVAAALGVTPTDNGDGTVTLEASDGETGYSITVADDGLGLIAFTEYTTPVACTATTTGVTLVTTGMIDTIVTPVAGLVSVYNYGDGDVGRETETDAELRIRLRSVRRGAATADAIRSRIIAEVEGVSTCLVIENSTGAAVGSQPAHSVHVIVQGGADQDIVDKLWALKPAGIATYGTSSGTATDGAGNTHTVYFSRPTTRYAHVRVRYTVYSEETLPAGANDAIEAAILAYGNTFVVGQDMLWQRFLTPVLTTVDGIASAVIELDHTAAALDAPTYVTDTDHAVDDDQLVAFALARIDVDEA